MKLIIAIMLTLSSAVYADDLILGEYTHHFKDLRCKGCKPFTNEHPLLGYSTDDYIFFAMKNSYDKDSVAVLRSIKTDVGQYLTPFAAAGLVTGYEQVKPKYIYAGVAALGYIGMDIHPASNDVGLVITWVPGQFIGAGIRFRLP